ncbi:hypothetical protein ACWC1D_25680 [Streptomyces sp. NPDC001478]
MSDRDSTDLRTLPHHSEIDRDHLPPVEEELDGVRQAVIGDIGHFRSGFYVPIAPAEGGTPRGGMLSLSQAQLRHLHAELGKLIGRWDSEPRDLADEADRILGSAPGRRFFSRTRASSGYEIETDGTTVHVYLHTGHGRARDASHLYSYARALADAGYTGPGDHAAPVVCASDGCPARVEAVPPAATSF